MDLLSAAQEFSVLRGKSDSSIDATDRLTSKFIIIGLVVILVLVTNDAMTGSQIDCHPTDELSSSDQSSFIIYYCWVNNTRSVLPGYPSHDTNHSHYITYYQWSTFIIIALIVIYLIPWVIYRSMLKHYDVSLSRLAAIASNYNISSNENTKGKAISDMAAHINSYLASNPSANKYACLYLFIKFLNIATNIFAMVFLSLIFGPGYFLFFFTFMYKLIVQNSIKSQIFPVEVYCDFELYVQSTNRDPSRYTMPCLLPVNLFLIFIFAFVNIIQIIVLIFSAINLFLSIGKISYRGRKTFLKNILRGSPHYSTIKELLEYLGSDGVLFIILLEANCSLPVILEVVNKLALVQKRTRLDPHKDSYDEDEVPQDYPEVLNTGSPSGSPQARDLR